MLQLRCTGKVIKELGLKPMQLAEIKKPESLLGNWYVNISTIDRRKTFLFTNEKTLLSFIIYGVKKSNIGRIHNTFLSGLSQLLEVEDFDQKLIDRVIDEYEHIEYTKTDSRKVLGNMNDIMSLYDYSIHYDGGLKQCNVGEIILQINRTPQRNLGWSNSITVVSELLRPKY